jgi:glycosyltransferase involved in cell wall biosynthesis
VASFRSVRQHVLGYRERSGGTKLMEKIAHSAALALFALVGAFWLFYGLRVAVGAFRLSWLKDFPPAKNADCPKISLIFAARDEEEKLAAALNTLISLDYPHLEIIGVDDRSTDGTARILDEFAAGHERVKPVHVSQLPTDWLGKPHALQSGYEQSTGDWLLFTDADVRFKPDSLRRAIQFVLDRKLEHLTLLTDAEMHGFWETVVLTFFGSAFSLGNDAPSAGNPNSRAYVGVGAFQLVRRKAYEASGTHRRLAFEVIDDMKLAKVIKQAGFRSAVGVSGDFIVVRWHSGLGSLVRGTTKNFFAAFGYRLDFAIASVIGVLLVNVVPLLGLILGHGWIRILSAVSVAIALGFQLGVDLAMRVSPWYALTYPLGATICAYMAARSVVVTLWRNGVTWRGTFYPLNELRRRMV